MTSTEQERIVRFINAAREHRQWLSRELSSLDALSENYGSNQRAIRGATGELDKAIWKAMEPVGMVGSCRMTVKPDGISAMELTGTVSTRCAPAK
jgi:hypothetical protein